MREADYQGKLIKRLRDEFPGCVILKNDTDYLQGIPDLTLLFYHLWAWLEVKAAYHSPNQPNQEYYIAHANEHSFGAFIYPENEDEVIDALQQSFKSRW